MTSDECAIPPSVNGPWCAGHTPGFAKHCWGTCASACPDGYEEVPGCHTSYGCKFFTTAPLCKARISPPELATTTTVSCGVTVSPYVQCSGNECPFPKVEVHGVAAVW